MANIHITLVGGQTAPVYMGIVSANPDRVILVCSEQTIDEADRIEAQIEVFCEKLVFHPVDLIKIETAINKIKSLLKQDDQVSINVGGGTKPWSILFYEHFKDRKNVSIVYMDQNNFVWNLATKTYHEVEFDMDVHFKLYGNPLTRYRLFTDFSSSDREVVAKIREIRKLNFVDFNFLTDSLYRFPHEKKAITRSGSELVWSSTDKSFRFSMLCRNKQIHEAVLKSPLVRELVLNTGWFEFEVAYLLESWSKARQQRLNCIFPAKAGSPKNEIDIIINAGSKLLFVECKTQLSKETDIDKFASAVRVYGGLGSKALFVTDAPMSDKAIEKCADHGIMTFSLQNNLLGLSPEVLLYKMLDSELFNLNAR